VSRLERMGTDSDGSARRGLTGNHEGSIVISEINRRHFRMSLGDSILHLAHGTT